MSGLIFQVGLASNCKSNKILADGAIERNGVKTAVTHT